MVLASAAFSAMGVCVKLASAQHGPFEIVLWRGALGTAALAAWGVARREHFVGERFGLHLSRSLVGAVSLTGWYYALTHLPLATAMTLNYTSPLFIAAILVGAALPWGAPGRIRPRIETPLVVALAFGFAGVVILLRPSFASDDALPAAIGLGSGAVAALAYLQVKRLGRLGEPAWRIVFWFCAVQIGFGAVGTLIAGGAHRPDARGAALLAGVAASAMLGQFCMTRAFSRGKTLLAANLQYLGVVFATAAGWWLLGERIGATTVVGIAIILASGATASVLTARGGAPAVDADAGASPASSSVVRTESP